jgi:hypothetical protein
MPIKSDPLKQFALLRQQLTQRKVALEAELAEINKALSGAPLPVISVANKTAKLAKPVKKARVSRPKNTVSLKEAVFAAVANGPLTKQEILDAVTASGYQFAAKNPLNSLNTLLYTGEVFKNEGGKFSKA